MKQLLYISIVVLLLLSCSSPKQKGKYASYYKESFQEEFLKGPVKTTKGVLTYLVNTEETPKDSMHLYSAAIFLDIYGGSAGYKEYDKYGTIRKWYGLDSLQQPLLGPDQTRIVRKKGNRYIHIYTYFEEDIQKKIQYKQQTPIKKYVFNPYRVYMNTYTYQPYDFKVKKDSTAKELIKAFRYILNSDGTPHQEKSIALWDKNLDGIVDKEIFDYEAIYNYNSEHQLISKNFKISTTSYIPDHFTKGVDFTMTDYEPYETYTYDVAGNLTSVFMYTYEDPEKRKMVFSEEYKYNDQHKLVWMRRRATPITMMGNKHMRRTNVFEFNSKGQVAKIIAYENDEKTIHATYAIRYSDYDNYDNWKHCEFYLNDREKPYAEVNRIIEYYKN